MPSEQILTLTDARQQRTPGILATPKANTECAVVMCHGFLSNKNSHTNKALTAHLLPHGIATFRFDFSGQGESDGAFEQLTVGLAVDQALAALCLMITKGYRKLGLVGSSFGGLVAILATARFGKEKTAPQRSLAAMALKCPVSDFPAMLRSEFGEAGMAQWRATDTIPNVSGGTGRIRLPYSFYEDCVRYDAYAAARDIHVPTLIVHGDADEYVPVAQSRRLEQALDGTCSLVIMPGADHHFSQPDHFREMVAGIGQWMMDRLLTDTTG